MNIVQQVCHDTEQWCTKRGSNVPAIFKFFFPSYFKTCLQISSEGDESGELTCAHWGVAPLSIPLWYQRQAVQSAGLQVRHVTDERSLRLSIWVTVGGLSLRVLGGLQSEVTGQTTTAIEPHHNGVRAGADLSPVYRAAGSLSGLRLKQEVMRAHQMWPRLLPGGRMKYKL